jgi:hypothetical protein
MLRLEQGCCVHHPHNDTSNAKDENTGARNFDDHQGDWDQELDGEFSSNQPQCG